MTDSNSRDDTPEGAMPQSTMPQDTTPPHARRREAASLHTSVMLDRCVDLLAPVLERDGATVMDATLGMGGHTEAMLNRFPGLTVIGLDRDTEALELAGARLAPFGDRF